MRTELSRIIRPDTEACYFIRICGMKALIAVVLLCLTTLCLFGANTINASIHASLTATKIEPRFRIYGGLDENFNTVAIGAANVSGNSGGGQATYELRSSADISIDDITVWVKILQYESARFISVAGFDISVTASALKLNGTSNESKTADPTVVEESIWSDTMIYVDDDGNEDFSSELQTSRPVSGSTMTYRVKYPTGVTVPEIVSTSSGNVAVLVGRFAYQWEHDTELPDGTYVATITMRFTPQ